jgi:hypothetical protein
MSINEKTGLLSAQPVKGSPFIDVRTIGPSPRSPYGHTKTSHHHLPIDAEYGSVCRDAIPELMLSMKEKRDKEAANEADVSFIINLSLGLNIVLFIGKVAAYYLSGMFLVTCCLHMFLLRLVFCLSVHHLPCSSLSPP